MKVDASGLTEEAAADLISSNPRIMLRPLLTDGKRLVTGFDPEQMQQILGQ